MLALRSKFAKQTLHPPVLFHNYSREGKPLPYNSIFQLCTLHSALCTLHSALFTLCTLHFALCTLHSALCTLHSALCTLHSLNKFASPYKQSISYAPHKTKSSAVAELFVLVLYLINTRFRYREKLQSFCYSQSRWSLWKRPQCSESQSGLFFSHKGS